MLEHLNNHSTNETLYKFCSLLRLTNNYTFQYLHSIIPIYRPKFCYNFTLFLQHNLINMMQYKEYVPLILKIFYKGSLEFNHKLVYPIIINLSGDAASLKSAFKSSKEAVYVFEVLPLDCKLRQCVIHIIPTKNGSSPKKVVDRFFEIAPYLTKI